MAKLKLLILLAVLCGPALAQTPNLGLTILAHGAAKNTWDQATNANWNLVDAGTIIKAPKAAQAITGGFNFTVNGNFQVDSTGNVIINPATGAISLSAATGEGAFNTVSVGGSGGGCGTYAGICWFTGLGSPEGVITAHVGSIYSDGNALGGIYLKSNGVSNTGWVLLYSSLNLASPGPIGNTTPSTISSDMALDCAQYAGATVDVKVNACIAAVIAAGGGTADARGLGGNQSIAAQITVGDGSTPVTLLLPIQAVWSPDAITNNTDCAIQQLGNTTIISQNVGGSSGMQISSSSSAARLYAMYCSTAAGGVYMRLDGVKFRNQGHATASGIGFYFQGSFDNSTVSNVTVYDFKDTYAAEIQHSCCATAFYNFTVNGENTAGITSLYIRGNEPSPPTNEALEFYNLSVDAPGNGFPNILADDAGASHRSAIDIFGLYEEGNTSDTTTTMNQVDGVGRFTVTGAVLKTESGAGSTQAAFSLSNTANTNMQINGLSMRFGASYPRTAIINSNTTSCPATPCNIQADARGNVSSYATGTQYSTAQSSTTYSTWTNCAGAGTAANPSVASCASSASGAFSCATNASTGTCTVNTTAVTANSRIFIMPSAAEGANLSVTCNTTSDTGLTAPRLASKSAGTSFTINLGTFTTNPECFNYFIIN